MQTRAIVWIVGFCLVGLAGVWGGAGAATVGGPVSHPLPQRQATPAPSTQDKTGDAQAISRMAKEEYENCASFHEHDSADFKPFCKCFADNRARIQVANSYVSAGTITEMASNRCMGLWPDSHAGASAHSAQ